MTTVSHAADVSREILALFNLALRQQNAGQLAEAVAGYQQILVVRPDLFQAHNNLGGILQSQGHLDQALQHFQQVLTLQPNLAEAHFNVGNVLKAQGQVDAAVAHYERALLLDPRHAGVHNNLANAQKQLGCFDEAQTHYEQAVALKPDLVEATLGRVELKTFRPQDADLAELERLAAGSDHLPAHKMVHVHFALAKALEDTTDYPRAFKHWLRGNALKRREVNYEEAAYQRTFQIVAQTIDSALLDRLAGAGDPSAAPIFVLGMPRSGSTLVEQILASHPRVHAAGELASLDKVVNSYQDPAGQPVPFPVCLATLDRDILREWGQAYLASLPQAPTDKDRIVDKTPGNFLYVGLIRRMFPNARIIHTVRDPADNCLSCFSRLFTPGVTFSYDLGELGRYYRWYRQLMAHWRRVLPADTMLEVSYEDVVDNLEEQARRLVDYCGLPWDDRCLRFHETRRPIATASSVQVRKPVYRSSIGRWRHYEEYLGPLLAELDAAHAHDIGPASGGQFRPIDPACARLL